ncbi:MAG: endospore germination permease [Bacillaceae bacterium]|nr:endospore germination permease [Bacillaceae bacterium]
MNRNFSLSTTQVTWLIVASAPVGINTLPRVLNEQTQQTGWLFLMASALLVYLFMRIIIILPARYPGQTIFEISSHVLGRWVGGLFILFVTVMMILGTGLSLRLLADGVINYILFHTPRFAVIFSMLMVVIYALSRGVETIAYINEIFQPLILLSMTLILLLVINKADFSELTPILSDEMNIAQGAAASFYPYVFILTIVYFFPYIKDHTVLKRGLIFGIITILWIVIKLFILSVTLFGTVELNYIEYPSIEFARLIQFPILERFHILYLIYWVIYSFTVHTVSLHVGATGINYFMPKAPLMTGVLIASVIAVSFSLYPDNIERVREYATYLNYVNTGLVFMAFPLLVLIDTIKRKVKPQ